MSNVPIWGTCPVRTRDPRSQTVTGRNGVQFSTQEIHGAKELRDFGLRWQPQPGHYVWDEAGLIEQPSPFQDGVYFILDLKHFLRRAGTLDGLKQSMVWLPTWRDARLLLQTMGIDNSSIAEALQAQSALEQQQELLTLYGLIAVHLQAVTETASLALQPAHETDSF